MKRGGGGWFAMVPFDWLTAEKYADLPAEPFSLLVKMTIWSAREQTDGQVPGRIGAGLGRKRGMNVLESRQIVVRNEAGFRLVDFLDVNHSKAQIQAKRAANTDRQRTIRSKSNASVTNFENESNANVVPPDKQINRCTDKQKLKKGSAASPSLTEVNSNPNLTKLTAAPQEPTVAKATAKVSKPKKRARTSSKPDEPPASTEAFDIANFYKELFTKKRGGPPGNIQHLARRAQELLDGGWTSAQTRRYIRIAFDDCLLGPAFTLAKLAENPDRYVMAGPRVKTGAADGGYEVQPLPTPEQEAKHAKDLEAALEAGRRRQEEVDRYHRGQPEREARARASAIARAAKAESRRADEELERNRNPPVTPELRRPSEPGYLPNGDAVGEDARLNDERNRQLRELRDFDN